MKIRIISKTPYQGYRVGDELDVSAPRAARWAEMGIARILGEFIDSQETIQEVEEAPKPRKRGRPRKVRTDGPVTNDSNE